MCDADTCPFTLAVLDRRASDGSIRLSVTIPDGNAPLMHKNDCDACQMEAHDMLPEFKHEYERNWGHATWPTDERVAAEAARQLGHLVTVEFFDCADGRLDEAIYHAESKSCLGNAFDPGDKVREALDGLTVHDSDGDEVLEYATCFLTVEADLAGTDHTGLCVTWGTGERPWSRERVRRMLDDMDPGERRALYEAASTSACTHPVVREVVNDGISVPLCEEYAREDLLNLITTDTLAKYLCAEYGMDLALWSDGTTSLVEHTTAYRGAGPLARIRCPGISNLDSTRYSDGYAHLDEQGRYVETLTGRVIGNLEALIRECCDEGDVAADVDMLRDLFRQELDRAAT